MKYQEMGSINLWKRTHLKKFLLGMAGFGLMMAFSIFVGKQIESHLIVKIIIALLPIIPFIIALTAFIANIKVMDEMWKKIQSDALIMTALITLVFSLSIGMLQVMNLIGVFSIFYLFMLIMIVWSFCFAYVTHKVNGEQELEE